jgi:hypothetical protein
MNGNDSMTKVWFPGSSQQQTLRFAGFSQFFIHHPQQLGVLLALLLPIDLVVA